MDKFIELKRKFRSLELVQEEQNVTIAVNSLKIKELNIKLAETNDEIEYLKELKNKHEAMIGENMRNIVRMAEDIKRIKAMFEEFTTQNITNHGQNFTECPNSTNDNYENIEGKCFYFQKQKVDFDTAKGICKSKSVTRPGIIYEQRNVSNWQLIQQALKEKGRHSIIRQSIRIPDDIHISF